MNPTGIAHRISVTPEALDSTSRTFRQGADHLHEVVTMLERVVRSLDGNWLGASKAAFFARWEQIQRILRTCPTDSQRTATMLGQIAHHFREAEQRAQAASSQSSDFGKASSPLLHGDRAVLDGASADSAAMSAPAPGQQDTAAPVFAQAHNYQGPVANAQGMKVTGHAARTASDVPHQALGFTTIQPHEGQSAATPATPPEDPFFRHEGGAASGDQDLGADTSADPAANADGAYGSDDSSKGPDQAEL